MTPIKLQFEVVSNDIVATLGESCLPTANPEVKAKSD